MRSNKSKEVELYEILFLLDPKLQEKEVSDTIESYQEFLINQGSSVMVQNQGRRKLSFPIKRVQAANFIQFVFLGNGKLIDTFKTTLQRDELVLRHLITKLNGPQEMLGASI